MCSESKILKINLFSAVEDWLQNGLLPSSWARLIRSLVSTLLTCPSSAVNSPIPIPSSLNHLVIFSWHFGIFLAECILLFCVYLVATFHESACAVLHTHRVPCSRHLSPLFCPSCSRNYSLSPTVTASPPHIPSRSQFSYSQSILHMAAGFFFLKYSFNSYLN